MIVEAAKHVLAHAGHYRTVAVCETVAREDRELLEQLQFGQTNDKAYLASLATDPALLLRRLPSGRCGLTRVFQGQNDAAGRKTLAFVTLIVEQREWVGMLAGNVLAVATLGGTVWDLTTTRVRMAPPQPMSVDDGSDGEVARALRARLGEALEAQALLVSYSDLVTLPALASAVAVSPPAQLATLSFAYRALSHSLPVQLNVLERRLAQGTRPPASVVFDSLTPDHAQRTPPMQVRKKPVEVPRPAPSLRPSPALPIKAPRSLRRGQTTLNTILLIVVAMVACASLTLQVIALGGRGDAATAGQGTGGDAKDLQATVVDIDHQLKQLGDAVSQKLQSLDGRVEALQKERQETHDLVKTVEGSVFEARQSLEKLNAAVAQLQAWLAQLQARPAQTQPASENPQDRELVFPGHKGSTKAKNGSQGSREGQDKSQGRL